MTAAPALPPFFDLIALDEVASTNDEARLRAERGARAGTFVWGRVQTRGRARRGRNWVSPEGNLYCSLLLRPAKPLAEAPQLSFVAALAVSDAVRSAIPGNCPVRCKWPNDVLADGRKVSGLLLESHAHGSSLDWLVMGIGINVATRPPDDAVETPATSLRELGAAISVEGLLADLAVHLEKWIAAWEVQGFGPVRQEWIARSAGHHREIRVRLGRETFHGVFEDIDADGALIVALEGGGQRRVTAGEVFHV